MLLDRRLMWGNESLPLPCEVNTISLISGGTGNALLSHSKKAGKNTGGVVGEAYSSPTHMGAMQLLARLSVRQAQARHRCPLDFALCEFLR